MSHSNLLSPPTHIAPPTALALSQKAPRILSRPPTCSLPWPLSLLFSRETPESWTIHENLFYSALRTGDEASARAVLERLEARFGEHNERIITLRGIYNEAGAHADADLEKVFEGYEKILEQDATNMSVRKRRVAVLKALGRTQDAITAVTVLLTNSPTDVEAWAEASELYASQGAWGQAIYCAEEVLLVMPNAASAHAHTATLHYLSTSSSTPPSLPALSLALKHFCRAVELNDSYLRGYYGLKLVSSKLVPLLADLTSTPPSKRSGGASQDDDEIPIPNIDTVKKLEEIAAAKLGDMVRNASSGKTGGYGLAEVIAARELLDRHGKMER